MATSHMSEVIQHLRRAVLLPGGAGLTDGQLLADFLGRRDEAALAALVGRHGPMVWGVCRRILRNHHDAEDAFQAAFLVLVRKGASIASRASVASWLYGVARRTALKARATTARRRTRERQVVAMPEPAVVDQDPWRDLEPLLDEELARLPDKYRAVVVLCDLEGLTRTEAARQLGCPPGTVAGRLARARAMLAKRLRQRGVVLSGGALAAVVAGEAASAGVPASVVSSTIKAATLFAAGRAAATGVISAEVAALTEGVLQAMLLTKLKAATVVLLLAAALSAAAGLICHTPAAGQPPGQRTAQGPKADKGQPPGAKDDLGELQGTWRAVAAVNDGSEVGGDSPNVNHRLVIEKASLTLFELTQPATAGAVADFTLDTKRRPKLIVLAWKENFPFGAEAAFTQEAIYALEGDTLKLCLSLDRRDLKAPTAFSSDAGSRRGLWTFRREPRHKKKEPAAREGAGKGPKVLTPEEAINQRPKEQVTVQFNVTSVEVTPLDGPKVEGYAEGPHIRLKDGGRFSVLLLGPASDRVMRLGIEPGQHFRGKAVRVTGQVRPDQGEGPPFAIWVDDLSRFEVVQR
jgi:RNA polymerase sigma factor (sigma-70 family)